MLRFRPGSALSQCLEQVERSGRRPSQTSRKMHPSGSCTGEDKKNRKIVNRASRSNYNTEVRYLIEETSYCTKTSNEGKFKFS